MRVWDIEARMLCDRHLLGEHVEIHAIFSIISKGLKGYSSHPEVARWRGRLGALYIRHDVVAGEMVRRGFRHRSDLSRALATGSNVQDRLVDQISTQIAILRKKGCGCRIS